MLKREREFSIIVGGQVDIAIDVFLIDSEALNLLRLILMHFAINA